MYKFIIAFLIYVVFLETTNPAIPLCVIVIIAGYLFNLFWYNGLLVFKNERFLLCFILSVFMLLIQLLILLLSTNPNQVHLNHLEYFYSLILLQNPKAYAIKLPNTNPTK
jgi:hypothetical protein